MVFKVKNQGWMNLGNTLASFHLPVTDQQAKCGYR